MKPSREQVMTALFNALTALVVSPVVGSNAFQVSAGGNPTITQPIRTLQRRVVSYSNSGPKPAIYIGEFGQAYKWQSENLGTVTLEPVLFIYTEDGSDPNSIPSVMMNNIMDAIDQALKPDDGNGKCTLGGLVSSCRSFGEVPIAPGDLSGPGVAVNPLNIKVANGDLS